MTRWLQTLFRAAAPAIAPHLVTGERGEREAARYLRQRGYKVLTCRFTGKHGELDIVARDGEVLAFVEVKTRGSQQFGAAADAVDAEKQAHLASCAREYLRLLGNPRIPIRFDIVEVYMDESAPKPREVRLIQGAFTMPDHISD